MTYIFKQFIKSLSPDFVIKGYYKFLEIKKNRKENKVLKYFRNMSDGNIKSPEIVEIKQYFKTNSFTPFPYSFVKKHDAETIAVHSDEQCGMQYVMHDNKRMYYPKNMDEKSIRNHYNWLLIEQDTESPHRYETEDFHVNKGDVILDIGSSEGMFALTNIEKARKLYLFECDHNWIEALNMTFKPWKDKVHIINKYAADYTNGNMLITIDDFISTVGERVNFIKADIEGAELSLLKGAAHTMKTSSRLSIAICAYHRENDAVGLAKILSESGFTIEFSQGYMLFLDKTAKKPYLRKGIIRASKNK